MGEFLSETPSSQKLFPLQGKKFDYVLGTKMKNFFVEVVSKKKDTIN